LYNNTYIMSTEDTAGRKEDIALSVCANCGKGEEESDKLKACTACMMVKYCNRECQIAHRSQHKKECRKRAAELHDEALFKEPPPADDCPICFNRIPRLETGWRYYACCGKVICSGCSYAPVYDNQGNEVDNDKQNECPFCRVVAPKSDKELIKRLNKRVEAGDAEAIYNLGWSYRDGTNGYPQDYTKALELFHRAGSLGDIRAYNYIGFAYENGRGVEIDKKKAIHYYKLSAMGGNVAARYNLGCMELQVDNVDRAIKHFMIAARGGEMDSLNRIKKLYSNGQVAKDDYMKALRLYQAYLSEIKSKQRDEAAAAHDQYRYY